MLIRSKRPFQGGGNEKTEKSGSLELPEGTNGGWKQMVGCQKNPLPPPPLPPSITTTTTISPSPILPHSTFPLLCSSPSIFVYYEGELTLGGRHDTTSGMLQYHRNPCLFFKTFIQACPIHPHQTTTPSDRAIVDISSCHQCCFSGCRVNENC